MVDVTHRMQQQELPYIPTRMGATGVAYTAIEIAGATGGDVGVITVHLEYVDSKNEDMIPP